MPKYSTKQKQFRRDNDNEQLISVHSMKEETKVVGHEGAILSIDSERKH